MLQELTARSAQPSTTAPIAPTPPATPPTARTITPPVPNVISNDDGLRPFDPDLYGANWQDVDGDCQDTRTEALLASLSILKPHAGGETRTRLRVYVATWRQIKRKWNLSADDAENSAVERVLQECAQAGK